MCILFEVIYLKVIFMGTPEFAVPTLKLLIEKHNVVGVVTQPDRPKGRGKKMLAPPVKEIALENNIPVFQPEKIRDEEFISKLEDLGAEVFVIVAYGQLLPEKILNMPKYGCINVHGSLLPKYRGAAPIQWALIDGEKITGVTIMYMEKGLDKGDMIVKKEIPIDEGETYGSLHDKMAPVGASALIEALTLIEKGVAEPEKQDDSLSCYAKKIEKGFGKIDWNKNSDEILNFIRGLNPTPCAYTLLNGEVLKIWNAEKIPEGAESPEKAGTVIKVFPKKGFAVKTNDLALIITEVQAKGGKKMNCSDYLRGHSIEIKTLLE